MQTIVDTLLKEFTSIRTGRANTALIDGIRVESYGRLTPINQLASVSIPDSRTIVIQSWDMTQLKDIEKAILKSGLIPLNDGKVLRLTVAPLTEERRRQLTKTVGKFAEDARVAIRNVRREANDTLKAQKVSKDEERRGYDQIQKTTDQFIAKVDELARKKEQEVMTV